ncbi:MAG: hypothetical protein EOO88_21795 [Pedobacter sp.]|nr:MAG: hypothetical protein EOO88_21795 [Pedobacter sp.]
MATLKNGIFGGVSGKVGNTIYYMLNGKQMARKVGRTAKSPTSAQLANRQAMKVTIDFLRPLSAIIRTGFGLEAERRNIYPQNAAVGYNKSCAIKGQYPNLEMDYEKVLVSTGNMLKLYDPGATWSGNAEDGYSLWFNWDVGMEDREWPRCNDVVLLLAYFPEVALPEEGENREGFLHAEACIKTDGARRKEGQDVLEIPAHLAGRPMEVYIAVVSENGRKIADSQYLGRMMAGS